jgi:hypothetical protein
MPIRQRLFREFQGRVGAWSAVDRWLMRMSGLTGWLLSTPSSSESSPNNTLPR